MKERQFAAGEEIIHLNQKCKEITWIIEGEVDIEIHNNNHQGGEKVSLDILKKGDVIG